MFPDPIKGFSSSGAPAKVNTFPEYDRGAVVVETTANDKYDESYNAYTLIQISRADAIKLAIRILRAATE